MNGSVDLLAKAMRSVFTEAVAEGVQPVKDAVDGLKKDVDKRMDRVDSHLADLSTRSYPSESRTGCRKASGGEVGVMFNMPCWKRGLSPRRTRAG